LTRGSAPRGAPPRMSPTTHQSAPSLTAAFIWIIERAYCNDPVSCAPRGQRGCRIKHRAHTHIPPHVLRASASRWRSCMRHNLGLTHAAFEMVVRFTGCGVWRLLTKSERDFLLIKARVYTSMSLARFITYFGVEKEGFAFGGPEHPKVLYSRLRLEYSCEKLYRRRYY
jgi:hypothetical protein